MTDRESRLLAAAVVVANFHWSTSASENYHFSRIAAIEDLREAILLYKENKDV